MINIVSVLKTTMMFKIYLWRDTSATLVRK